MRTVDLFSTLGFKIDRLYKDPISYSKMLLLCGRWHLGLLGWYSEDEAGTSGKMNCRACKLGPAYHCDLEVVDSLVLKILEDTPLKSNPSMSNAAWYCALSMRFCVYATFYAIC